MYDIGGEIQRILEDNVHLKLTEHSSFYDHFDSMLKIIIERVKDLQSEGKQEIHKNQYRHIVTVQFN